MVVGWQRNAMRLRLVQDFGRPEDDTAPMRASEARRAPPAAAETISNPPPTAAESAPAPEAPAEGGRGRPPGSRKKKPSFPAFRSGDRNSKPRARADARLDGPRGLPNV